MNWLVTNMKQDLDLKTQAESKIRMEQANILENVVFPRFHQQSNQPCFDAIFDLSGRILATTDYFAKYLGLKNKEQLINNRPNELGFTKNRNSLFWKKFDNSIHKYGADLLPFTKTRDGILITSSIKPIKDNLGNVFAFQAHTKNIDGELNYALINNN